jgi:hypothetical protein
VRLSSALGTSTIVLPPLSRSNVLQEKADRKQQSSDAPDVSTRAAEGGSHATGKTPPQIGGLLHHLATCDRGERTKYAEASANARDDCSGGTHPSMVPSRPGRWPGVETA